MMKLNAPSVPIFIISTVLIVLIILEKYFGVRIPVLTVIVQTNPFEVTLVAWAILFAGVAFKI